jgi:hypothetical protein
VGLCAMNLKDWQLDWLLEKAGWKIIDRQKMD